MIAKLSDELALELDRNGNRPLSVEDPRTHKLYVIVAEEDFGSNSQPPSHAPSQTAWNSDKNARRFALIDKEIAGTITQAETKELATLQQEMDDYLRRVAPFPIDAMRALHDQLLTRAQQSDQT
jgi:hypothetical protein